LIGDGPQAAWAVGMCRVVLAAGQSLVVDIDARSLSGGATVESRRRRRGPGRVRPERRAGHRRCRNQLRSGCWRSAGQGIGLVPVPRSPGQKPGAPGRKPPRRPVPAGRR